MLRYRPAGNGVCEMTQSVVQGRSTPARARATSGLMRVSLGLAIAWGATVAMAYVAFPGVEDSPLQHLGTMLSAFWWASPVATVPVAWVFIRLAHGRGEWWMDNRWTFAGFLTAVVVTCALLVGLGGMVIRLFMPSGDDAWMTEPLIGVVLGSLWTGLPLWSMLSGLLMGPGLELQAGRKN